MSLLQLTQTVHLVPRLPVRRLKKQQHQAHLQPTLPGMGIEEVPNVSNRQVAEVLAGVADMLEMRQDNPYRVQAYRNAARGILDLEEPASAIVKRGERLVVPGLGHRLRERIEELLSTGQMTIQHGFSLDVIPASVRPFLRLKHVGPLTVLRLYQEGIDSWEKLRKAVEDHTLRNLPGFGPRSEARLKQEMNSLFRRPSGVA